MCRKVNFNVIDKNKYDNIDDITKYIQIIVNKLIINEFANWSINLLKLQFIVGSLVRMMTSFMKTTKAKVSKIKNLC